MRKFIILGAVLALIGLASPARADLIIQVAEDANPFTTIANSSGSPSTPGGLLTFSVIASTTDYTIDLSTAKASQTSTLSELLSATLSVTNTTGSAGHILHIQVIGSGFTAPTTPPDVPVISNIGGTVVQTSSTNTLTFQSFVGGTPIGVQNPSITSPGSFNNTLNGSLSTLGAPFAIQENIDIRLDGLNNQINYSSSTALLPEPSSMALLAMGGCILGGTGLLRRRRAILVG